MTLKYILTLTASTVLLLACSGHPGAGNWLSMSEPQPGSVTEFSALEVTFEGRANIFGKHHADNSDAAIWRCFWGGVDAQTISMTCAQAANMDIEESYQLRVAPDNGIAELIKDEVVVGRFVREQ